MTHDLTHLITPITITRLATSAALAGSFWATLRETKCSTCQMASGLSGGLPLGRIGIAFYLIVLSATFLPGSTPVAWALAVAAGAHAVLASLLLANRVICRNCLLTAAAAVLALTSAILIDPSHNAWALLAVPVAGLAAVIGIGAAAASAARRGMQLAERLLAQAVKENGPVEEGKVKMIVLNKPGCHACEFLKESVLPKLEKEFAGVMEVEHRLAAPGTPAPTLLILGKVSQPFIGAAPAEAIAPTIRMALGDVVVHRREQGIEENCSAGAVVGAA